MNNNEIEANLWKYSFKILQGFSPLKEVYKIFHKFLYIFSILPVENKGDIIWNSNKQ